MAEVQDMSTALVVQVSHAAPDPVGSVADEHQAQWAQIVAAPVHRHPDTLEELVGMSMPST